MYESILPPHSSGQSRTLANPDDLPADIILNPLQDCLVRIIVACVWQLIEGAELTCYLACHCACEPDLLADSATLRVHASLSFDSRHRATLSCRLFRRHVSLPSSHIFWSSVLRSDQYMYDRKCWMLREILVISVAAKRSGIPAYLVNFMRKTDKMFWASCSNCTHM